MKRGRYKRKIPKRNLCVFLLLISILLVSPLILAQEQNQTKEQEQTQIYSGINRLTDNVKLAFSGGDNKVRQALKIREKEVNSAINNIQNQEEDKAIKNLERAKKKLEIVQEKVSLETSEEIKTSAEKIIDEINTKESVTEIFDDYLLEEEKTILVAELTEKTFEYCTELAKEDFSLMLEQEICDPETAVPGLEKELKELKDIQYKMFVQLMLEIRSCIDDPGTCNCEVNTDDSEKAKCEKMVALALKCEYKEDETSCDELEAMKPSPGDGFARSFVPDWLMNLFGEKYKMIEYGINHSDGVPEECWDWNEKPECRQYDYLKENNLDWDEYGNYRPILYPGKHPSTGGTPESPPTIQEAFPECYNEEGMFLSECGNINIVLAEDGSVTYIIDKQVDNIINDFENKSVQHKYAPGTSANGTDGQISDGEWTIDKGNWTVSNKAREIKKDMNQIQNQIKEITYAPGTGPGGDGRVIIDGDGQDVVTNNGGDSGSNVVDNVVAGNGGNGDVGNSIDKGDPGKNEVVGNEGPVPGDTIEEDGWVEKNEIFEGTGGEGSTVDP